jgi:hypothetical protein
MIKYWSDLYSGDRLNLQCHIVENNEMYSHWTCINDVSMEQAIIIWNYFDKYFSRFDYLKVHADR